MRKELLFSFLTIVALMTMVLATPMQAAAREKGATKFSAEAANHITDPGTSQITKQAGNLFFQSSQNEIIEGFVGSESWPELNGAYINIVHSADAVIDMKRGKLTGRGNGVITVVGVDGSMLTGSYHSIIQADFFVDENGNFVFTSVSDDGVWQLEGVSGVFEGIKATGTVRTSLSPVETPFGMTLGGSMLLNGLYK